MKLKDFNFSKDVLELIVERKLNYNEDYKQIISGKQSSNDLYNSYFKLASEQTLMRKYIEQVVIAAGKNKPINSVQELRKNIQDDVYKDNTIKFKEDTIKCYALENNLTEQQVGIIYERAYNKGHAFGLSEVLIHIDDLVEMVVEIIKKV